MELLLRNKLKLSMLLLYQTKDGSILRPLFHLLFTADLQISPETTSAIFADDTSVIDTDNDPAIASSELQANLLKIQSWLTKW
jgi:hypothetical protein